MKKNDKEVLEEKLVFRLINVSYIVLLIAVGAISIGISLESKPRVIPNQYKSYINCDDGKNFSFKQAYISTWDMINENTLDDYGDEKARILCAKYDRQKALDAGYSNYEIDSFIKSNLIDQKNYSLNTDYKVEGSWATMILYSLIGISMGYVVLNIIRETLLYIFFGKKFSWKWLSLSKAKKSES